MKQATTLSTFTFTTFTLATILGLAGTGAAFAGHYPEYRQMEKVKYLAHDLYKGAHYLHDHSARNVRHASYAEHEAIEDLHRLAERADRFYEQVGRYYREPRRTERDFRRLVRAYKAASRGFHDLSTYRRYHEDFECLIETMDKLAHYYGGYGEDDASYDDDDDDGRYSDGDDDDRDYSDRDYSDRSYGDRRYGDKRRYSGSRGWGRVPKEIRIIKGAYQILKAIEND